MIVGSKLRISEFEECGSQNGPPSTLWEKDMPLGTSELLIVLIIGILVFGGRQIPKLAKSIGSARREFEQALDES